MAGRKSKYIADGTNDIPQQGFLFDHPTLAPKPRYNPWPRLSRSEADIDEVLKGARKHVHIDLEFNSSRPTILGIANDELAVSIPWSTFQARKIVEHCLTNGKTLVAFSTCGADKKETDKALGVKTPLSLWEDAMLTHYLDNANLCKEPGKTEGDDESESGSLGLMNLGAASMLYTDLPMWKSCRHVACSGPCPSHDVWGYNAVDAYAGGQVFYGSLKGMEQKGIPFQFYRELLEVSDLCDEMQDKGILVDRQYIRKLTKQMDEGKAALFPVRKSGSKDIYDAPFNPKSGKQVKEFFWTNGIELENTTKDTVDIALEQQCRAKKIPLGHKEGKYDALSHRYGLWPWSSPNKCKATVSDDSDILLQLFRLYLFKASGKGVDSWFSDKYFDLTNRLHPRYSVTGTSMGRLSSGSPNFQNVAKHSEFGKALRRAIIPHPGNQLIESDFSQLEARIALWLSGFDPSVAGRDMFIYLLQRSEGAFDEAAERYGVKARQVVKSVVYGSNYCEGIDVLEPRDFTPRVKKEIEYGSRVLYKDWELGNGVVSFTGTNLAVRIFGSKSDENRKKALEVQSLYFRTFPMIREWQKRTTQFGEEHGYITSPTGRYLALRSDPNDNAKKSCAFLGQGVGADHVQAVMLRCRRELEMIPIGQIHDALITEVPTTWTRKRCEDLMSIMEEETWRLPGMKAPIKTAIGPNWADMEEE